MVMIGTMDMNNQNPNFVKLNLNGFNASREIRVPGLFRRSDTIDLRAWQRQASINGERLLTTVYIYYLVYFPTFLGVSVSDSLLCSDNSRVTAGKNSLDRWSDWVGAWALLNYYRLAVGCDLAVAKPAWTSLRGVERLICSMTCFGNVNHQWLNQIWT